ncbi:hypothetical protein RJT34_30745 [Clitoria ternatea]|uniref:Uncharacterized protein n=1 Tax=Clitoria ternatea TaxID=43366 RepID=A0AAN9EXJ7_CLITE
MVTIRQRVLKFSPLTPSFSLHFHTSLSHLFTSLSHSTKKAELVVVVVVASLFSPRVRDQTSYALSCLTLDVSTLTPVLISTLLHSPFFHLSNISCSSTPFCSTHLSYFPFNFFDDPCTTTPSNFIPRGSF